MNFGDMTAFPSAASATHEAWLSTREAFEAAACNDEQEAEHLDAETERLFNRWLALDSAAGLCLMWANCPESGLCAVCGARFASEAGPCVALRVADWAASRVCDTCTGGAVDGVALLAVRDRFNASLAADTRALDNIGRPLAEQHAGLDGNHGGRA